MAESNDVDLDELERLSREATPGPWEAYCIDEFEGVTTPSYFRYEGDSQIWQPGWDVRGPLSLGNHECGAITEPDAAFIAAARTAVPALVAKVRELEAEVARLREGRCECGAEIATVCPKCDRLANPLE